MLFSFCFASKLALFFACFACLLFCYEEQELNSHTHTLTHTTINVQLIIMQIVKKEEGKWLFLDISFSSHEEAVHACARALFMKQ